MERVEQILQDSGSLIQPFWRSIFRHSTEQVKDFPAHQAQEIHLERVWLDT